MTRGAGNAAGGEVRNVAGGEVEAAVTFETELLATERLTTERLTAERPTAGPAATGRLVGVTALATRTDGVVNSALTRTASAAAIWACWAWTRVARSPST